MSEDVKAFFAKFKGDMGKVQQQLPEVIRAFRGLFDSAMNEGELSVKQKELIALGIGVAAQCCPCIYLHVQKCLAAGASAKEVLEAASVAVVMGGGPAFTHLPEVVDALEACQG